MNLHTMIFTRQVTPAMPSALLPTAPTMPATWVPWPQSSFGLPL
jgi:hypothetical protein